MKNLTDISRKWKICLNLDQHQTSDNDVCNVVMMPWHYQLPPEVPHYQDPSLVTAVTLGPGINTGHWEQLASDTCQWRAGLRCEEMMAGPRAGVGLAITPRHLIITPQCQQRQEIITLQHRIKSKNEAPGCENLNKRHNYSVFPAKNSPAPVHCHFPLALESWPQSLRNTFLIILGKFMTFCEESED